jgi:hypothetical protein
MSYHYWSIPMKISWEWGSERENIQKSVSWGKRGRLQIIIGEKAEKCGPWV